MKKGDRVSVLWAQAWEPGTFIKKACLEGCVVVKLDSSVFESTVHEDEVRPPAEEGVESEGK